MTNLHTYHGRLTETAAERPVHLHCQISNTFEWTFELGLAPAPSFRKVASKREGCCPRNANPVLRKCQTFGVNSSEGPRDLEIGEKLDLLNYIVRRNSMSSHHYKLQYFRVECLAPSTKRISSQTDSE